MMQLSKMSALLSSKAEYNKARVTLQVFLKASMEALKVYSRRYQQRQQLMRLDDRALKDIGVSRIDAEQEGVKPFWEE